MYILIHAYIGYTIRMQVDRSEVLEIFRQCHIFQSLTDEQLDIGDRPGRGIFIRRKTNHL